MALPLWWWLLWDRGVELHSSRVNSATVMLATDLSLDVLNILSYFFVFIECCIDLAAGRHDCGVVFTTETPTDLGIRRLHMFSA